MRWMLQYRANNVFSKVCGMSPMTLGSLILSGNEFQATRPTGQQQRKPVGRTFATVKQKNQESSTGGPEMLSRSDVGDWYRQVLRRLTLQARRCITK